MRTGTPFSKEVFDLASRQLASQKEDLRNLRNQAAISSAITGLVAATGANALGDVGLAGYNLPPHILGMNFAIWLVAGLFFFALFFSARVLVSREACTFDHSAAIIFEQQRESASVEDLYRKLSREAEGFFDNNEKVLDRAHQNLTFSISCSVMLVPAWLLFIF
ncbi:hypothetical protein [Thioclava electrotropha]|uniref:SMODS and SLOG-associating 2TM effector domain-containing protein n=1 Tax=Thioclava electrotropha TaxID=1549850 RepID=A0ABX6YT16_9RHOB|nr:hypothetical protein [Thioclava electrotropha]QPZ90360.1 hypothetical protein AKL02_005285 [Thioclava electrotropha]